MRDVTFFGGELIRALLRVRRTLRHVGRELDIFAGVRAQTIFRRAGVDRALNVQAGDLLQEFTLQLRPAPNPALAWT
jgi:hypothetical protein